MKNITDTENKFFNFNFCLQSGDGDIAAQRFLNHFKLEIQEEQFESGNKKLIGKGSIYQVLIGQVYDSGTSFYEIFDETQSLMDLGNVIFDFEENDLNEDISPFFQDFTGMNICFIERIELLPIYRKIGLGKKVIKDIVHRFSPGCQMVVLKSFPIQFEGSDRLDKDREEEWDKKMEFKNMEADFEKANYKLFAYYQKLGFQNFLKNEYFFYNPALKNVKLDKIEF